MTPTSIYARAIAHYGNLRQQNKAMEECAELITALLHYMEGRDGGRDSVISEIADVEIMMAQMREIFGHVAVDQAKAEKLARLEGRIAQ